jgi:hypothetical protein
MFTTSHTLARALVHAEFDECVFAHRIDAIEELDPRRDFFAVRSNFGNQSSENPVDDIEVMLQRSELKPGSDCR